MQEHEYTPEIVHAVSMPQFAQYLRAIDAEVGLGLGILEDVSIDDSPHIVCTGPAVFQIAFMLPAEMEGNAAQDSPHFLAYRFMAGFSGHSEHPALTNFWNRVARFARAHIDREKAVIESDHMLAGGVTVEHVTFSIIRWFYVMGWFAEVYGTRHYLDLPNTPLYGVNMMS
jgi:hypothetical protein